MGPTSPRVVVLDAGALIGIERADERMLALLVAARGTPTRMLVPATVLAQVWRDGARQARLSMFLGSGQVEVVPLDAARARACGALCRLARTHDPIDASVVVVAREHRAVVVTSDLADLARLDPSLEIHAL